MDYFDDRKKTLRPFFSDQYLNAGVDHQIGSLDKLVTQSEPNFPTFAKKSHPLLDDVEDNAPHTFNELILAAETLENIVEEGTFAGGLRSRFLTHHQGVKHAGREMSDRASVKLVLPYIDIVLVKTQFLVFHNQFLNHLPLVKIMVYDAMKYHFNYYQYSGILLDLPKETTVEDLEYQKWSSSLVKELHEALQSFQVKLSAAYARLRIERKAAGETHREQMENILSNDVRQKEQMAIEMPKTLRINRLKTSKEEIAKQLVSEGYRVSLQPMTNETNIPDDLIYVDEDFEDLLIIPGKFFAEIKASYLVTSGRLVFQDKASMYGPKQIMTMIQSGAHVIDARAGCGTKTVQFSSIVGKGGKVFAFENRPGRLETLKSNLDLLGCDNVTIEEEEFITADVNAAKYANVSAVILEPSNSGTSLVDKLGYMLQEKEFPNDQFSLKDLYSLKRQQVNTLKHAFRFPNVKLVMYVTRSVHPEENEQVVQEALDRYGVDWELCCVLPNVVVEREHDYEIDECLKVRPSEQVGNGIFISCFQKKVMDLPQESQEDLARRVSDLNIGELVVGSSESLVKSKKLRKQGKPTRVRSYKLKKELSASVARLSIPRTLTVPRDIEPTLSKPKTANLLDDSRSSLLYTTPLLDTRQSTAQAQVHVVDNIGVFGLSLKKFYEPRVVAMASLQGQIVDNRWIYPVMYYKARFLIQDHGSNAMQFYSIHYDIVKSTLWSLDFL